LNFAKVCIQCGYRWCRTRACIEKHARSRWAVCEDCKGYGGITDEHDFCTCLNGLRELAPVGWLSDVFDLAKAAA
jgi:hypothetical protein